MVDNPLFYRDITILNRETHKSLGIETGATRFAFARSAHMIPAVLDEFAQGGRALPIVFVPGPARVTPVFLMGFQSGENVFVADDNQWSADYIPAFVRRYPFIIGERAGSEAVVCIDSKSDLLLENAGERLFSEDGADTPLLKNMVEFVNSFLTAAKQTDAFVDQMQALGLFQSVTIDARLSETETKTLHGTMSIDTRKFDALSDEDFGKLRKQGFLAPIYAHLFSLAALDKLTAKKKSAPAAAAKKKAAG